MRRANLIIAAVIIGGVVAPGTFGVRAAEPNVEQATSPALTPSIPSSFLDASVPFDPTTIPRTSGRPSGPPAPPSSIDIEAALTSQLLEGRNRCHHFSNFPSEEALANLPANLTPPQSPRPMPTSADVVAAQLQAGPPSIGHQISTTPLDDGAAFPLYHPGLTPPRYPGELVQFQQPSPDSPDQFGGVPFGAFQQRREELVAARDESIRGAWVASVEAVFLTDTSTVAGPALVQNNVNQNVLLAAPQITDSWGIGPRLTLTRNRSQNVSFDIGYLGIYNWDRQAQVLGSNNLNLAGPIALATVDFFGADSMAILYRTNINSFESNLILTPDWNMSVGSFVIGSRYIYWSEKFDIKSTDLDAGISDYIVRVRNRMYGGQIGWNGDIDSPIGGGLAVKVRGGVFMTRSSQAQTIYDFDNTFELRNAGSSSDRVSYLGETSIVQSYNPFRGFDVRFGYTLMWINGLARAPDQVDMSDTFNSGQAVIDTGHVFMHGFHLTAAYSW